LRLGGNKLSLLDRMAGASNSHRLAILRPDSKTKIDEWQKKKGQTSVGGGVGGKQNAQRAWLRGVKVRGDRAEAPDHCVGVGFAVRRLA